MAKKAVLYLTVFVLWSEIYDQPLAQRNHSMIPLERSRFEIGIRHFSCEAGSSPMMGHSSFFF